MNSRKMMSHAKRRGEWAELQFMAKAAKLGLQVCKPWGDLSRYDIVIGTSGHFVSVQIESTICRMLEVATAAGPAWPQRASLTSPENSISWQPNIVTKDVWYIIPAGVVIRGNNSSGICVYPSDPNSKYARYKEAWDLLR